MASVINRATQLQEDLHHLRDRIDALPGVVAVGESRRSTNMFGQPHIAFVNGVRKEDAPAVTAPLWSEEGFADLVEATFQAVADYRCLFEGDVFLTWRAEPEYEESAEHGMRLYLRLSFTAVSYVAERYAPMFSYPGGLPAGIEESFAETPQTLGERRSSRSHNGADWSPRDLLVRMLRDHDSGVTPLSAVVACFAGPKGAGFWSSAPDVITALGMLAAGQASYGSLVEKMPA